MYQTRPEGQFTLSSPAVHSVHIYDDSNALIVRLCALVASTLRVGDAMLVVATPMHREKLVADLQDTGVDVRAHAREGRFTMIDAGDLLSTFMIRGMPDSQLFKASVGSLLARSRHHAKSKSHGLTVFGEMVAVLWDEGKKQAALRLEALWNEALQDRAFHLHCAYPRRGFTGAEEATVCGMHSHLLDQDPIRHTPE